MRVALVHDYLTEYGGAERVLEALHELWPQAPLYTIVADVSGLGTHATRLASWDIRQSGMQYLPLFKKLMSFYRILAPFFLERWCFDEYDLVISSTSSYFTKGILTKPHTRHISYIHTPPRFLYGYITGRNWEENRAARFFATVTNHFLRLYDFAAAQRPDVLVANSQEVAARIKRYYGRDALVIYPPIDIDRFSTPVYAVQPARPYFLLISRLARAKHAEVAITACQQAHVQVIVAGVGREYKRLKERYPHVTFLGEVSDERLIGLYQGCEAVLFPAEEEDFGMVPVEAMAAGKPVIAYASGGVLETVIDGKTGILVHTLSADAFEDALKTFSSLTFSPALLKRHATRFSKERFAKQVKSLLVQLHNEPNAVHCSTQ